MRELEPRWSRRHKGRKRRIAYDVRLFAPIAAIVVCVAGSATAILAVERVAPEPTQMAGFEPLAPSDAFGASEVPEAGCRQAD